MKRSSLVMAALVIGAAMFSSIGSQAASPCGSDARTSQDPFGSCEKSDGTVTCGSDATAVGPVAHLDTTASGGSGVEGCANGSDALPVKGRAGVYSANNGDTTVFADGDDRANSGGAAAWDRVDVKSSGKVCVYRGSGGTYWTAGGGHSSADSVNQCTP